MGMWISTACAVHCAALPLILTVAGMGWLGEPWLEWSIITASFLIASVRLTHSYTAHHRRIDSLLLFALGAGFILLAKAELVTADYAEPLFMTIGGLSIAAAHWRNHHHCGCQTHAH